MSSLTLVCVCLTIVIVLRLSSLVNIYVTREPHLGKSNATCNKSIHQVLITNGSGIMRNFAIKEESNVIT